MARGGLFAATITGLALAAGLTGFAVPSQTTGSPGSASDEPPQPWPSFATTDPREQAFIARRVARLAELAAAPAPEPRDESEAGLGAVDLFVAHAAADAGEPMRWQPCDDAAFVRRAYLDVIGVTPTEAEAESFLRSADPDKRRVLVEALLARDAEYADHHLTLWEDALVSTRAGVTGGMASRGDYSAWLHEALRTNRPYDLLVAELLDPALPRHKAPQQGSDNGRPVRVHFVLNATHADTLQTAAVVGQVFLGTAMKCASCHNHFEDDAWPQTRFMAFAGFFAEQDLELIRCERRTGKVIPAAFPFEVPGLALAGEDGSAPKGLDARLGAVARAITDPHDPRFARALVNRLWRRLLGVGLLEPVDAIRDDVQASHPALLDWLADDFMRHGYDLRHAMRRILTSRTYQQRFDPALADAFDLEHPGEPRFFRSPQLRRLTAEQVIDSLRRIDRGALESSGRLNRQAASTLLGRALGRPAVRNAPITERGGDTAIVQGLVLLNSDEYHDLTRLPGLARRLGAAGPVERLDPRRITLAVLAREPSEAEVKMIRAALAGGEDGLHDLLWALVTGPEFAYIR